MSDEVEVVGEIDLSPVLQHVHASDALHYAAEMLLERAQDRVPYYDGTLADTGYVQSHGPGEAEVGYSHPDADRIHDAVDADIGQGEAQWLAAALDELQADLQRAVADQLGWG